MVLKETQKDRIRIKPGQRTMKFEFNLESNSLEAKVKRQMKKLGERIGEKQIQVQYKSQYNKIRSAKYNVRYKQTRANIINKGEIFGKNWGWK